jgi:hypothetical protein
MKHRANILFRYAPILALAPFSLLVADTFAEALQGLPHTDCLGGKIGVDVSLQLRHRDLDHSISRGRAIRLPSRSICLPRTICVDGVAKSATGFEGLEFRSHGQVPLESPRGHLAKTWLFTVLTEPWPVTFSRNTKINCENRGSAMTGLATNFVEYFKGKREAALETLVRITFGTFMGGPRATAHPALLRRADRLTARNRWSRPAGGVTAEVETSNAQCSFGCRVLYYLLYAASHHALAAGAARGQDDWLGTISTWWQGPWPGRAGRVLGARANQGAPNPVTAPVEFPAPAPLPQAVRLSWQSACCCLVPMESAITFLFPCRSEYLI